jgi:glycosyltransferase involved in cell wall biosynthesis
LMRDDLTSLNCALAAPSEGTSCSLVVPIYNDGYLAENFCAEVERSLLPKLDGNRLEVIFVNDGSANNSQQQLEAVARRYPWVTVIELSRNFGQHAAVTCGYRHASGAYVATLNADMQDPPDQVMVLIDRLEQGEGDLALGLRQNRRDPFFVRVGSNAFNLLLNFLTGIRVPLNSATLRVMNRKFLDAFLQFGERNPYIPGLETWLGFRRVFVPIIHQSRTQGKSSYTFRSRFRLAYNCILSFSDYPLKLMTCIGLATVCLGLLWGAYAIWIRLMNPGAQTGFASLLSAIVIFGGLNLAGLGVASLYIGRILIEVQGRPSCVVRSVFNREQPDHQTILSGNRTTHESICIS